MVLFSTIAALPLSDDILIENDFSSNLSNSPSITIHPLDFISLLCQQQEQYPYKLMRKICSNDLQSYKIQEQQRGKRVGWTISV